MLLLVFITGAPAQNLVTNGNFSANASLFTGGYGYVNQNGNPAIIPNWTIVSGSAGFGINGYDTSATVFFDNTYGRSTPTHISWTSTSGRTVNDFLFAQNAGDVITQAVAFAAGNTYWLSFDAATRAGGYAPGDWSVTIGGKKFDAGPSLAVGQWQGYGYLFLCTTATNGLSFAGTTNQQNLANVSVVNANGACWSGAASGNLGGTDVNFTGNNFNAATNVAGGRLFFNDTTGAGGVLGTTSLTVVAGGVSAGIFVFNNSVVNYAIASADTNGISGAATLVMNGTGMLTLTGSNTYTGSTTINAGTLAINGSGQLGGGSYAGAITNNGAISCSSSAAQILSGVISGNGSLAQAGSGTLTLTTSSNTYGGGTTLTGGILAMGTDYGANENAGSLGSGDVSISGGAQFRFGGTSGYPVVYYYFPAANSFTFNNGQFSVTDGGQHILGTVTVNSGGLTSYTRWIGKDLYLDGVVGGSGPITVDNYTQSGHQAYTHFSNAGNTWSGNLTIKAPSGSNGGAVSVDNNLALAVATVIDNNTGIIAGYPAMIFATGVTAPTFGALVGSGNIVLADGAGSAVALTVGGNNVNSTYSGVLSGSGSLTKNGSGTMTLSGTNTYLGNTTVNGGALAIAQPALATNATVIVAGGAVLKLNFSGTNTVAGLILNGAHQLPGVYNNSTSAPYLTGPGSLQVSFSTSTITLNPTNTYQQIYGIGGNLAGGEQQALINASTNLLASAFSPAGLNLSFVRMDNPYGQTEPAFNNLTNANNIVMSAFRNWQPNGKIMMTSWSPPGYLKNTGSAFQGTLAKNAQGKFVYTNFANWWASSLQYWQSNSTLPDFVSIQNEPDWYPSSGTNSAWQAGCELTATEGTYAGYNLAFAAVTNAFLANGFGSMKMIGPDTEGISGNIIPSYLNNLPAGSISVAHHPYGNNISTTGAGLLTTLNSQYPWQTTRKFMTEYDGDDWGTSYPDWMGMAVSMHNVFTLEHANAYLVWSLYYGLFNNPNGQPASDRYYVVGHFSKFIRPNDWIAQVTSSDTNILVSLYRHTNSNPAVSDQLILVMINKSSNYSYPGIQTTAWWATDPLQRSWQVYKTANDGTVQQRLTLVENLAGASLSGDRSLVLAPYSITTAIINTGVYTNAPPAFTSSAGNQTINPGQTLIITNSASDPNQPEQTLTFKLPTAPSGATLNSTNGILNWRPLIVQANTTNPFSIMVADNGSPSLSATQNFTVTVRPVTLPVASSAAMTNGQFQLMVNGAVGPNYTMQTSTDLVSWSSLFTTNPAALPFNWVDATATNFNQRFYRVMLGP